MGGGIALDFAAAFPEMVSRLVLVDTTLGGYRFSDTWDDSVNPIREHGRDGNVAEARHFGLVYPVFSPAMRK